MAKKIQPLFDYETGMPGTPVPPPRELGSHGQKLRDKVQVEYRIADCGGIEILYQLCATVDLTETLADVIRSEGPMLQTKSTRRTHPATRELIQARALVG